MDEILGYMSKIRDNLLKQWSELSSTQRSLGVATIVLILSGLIVLFFTQKDKHMQYLFTEISSEDSTAISKFLEKKGIIKKITKVETFAKP